MQNLNEFFRKWKFILSLTSFLYELNAHSAKSASETGMLTVERAFCVHAWCCQMTGSHFWPSAQNIEMYCLPPVHHRCDHCVMLTSWSVERVIQTKDYRSDVVVVASIIFDQTLRKSLCRLISAYCFHHLLPPNSRKISVLRSQQIY